MSKESNEKPKTGQVRMVPGGMRNLVDDVFGTARTNESNEIVQKNHENNGETISNTPVSVKENGLIDFRDFLEEYKAGDPYDRHTIYLTTDVKDVLDKLKASKELKKYTLKEILNSIVHAYVMEHRKDMIEIISSKKNNILD